MGKKSKREPRRAKREESKLETKKNEKSSPAKKIQIINEQDLSYLRDKLKDYDDDKAVLYQKTRRVTPAELFQLLRKITQIYADFDKIIVNYHEAVGAAYDQEIDKNNYLGMRYIEEDFTYMWKTRLAAFVREISENIAALIEIIAKHKQEMLAYREEETGDNIFHILFSSDISCIYFYHELQLDIFQVQYIKDLFFAQNKQGKSPYVLLLSRHQLLPTQHSAYEKAASAYLLQKGCTVEKYTEKTYFKIYDEVQNLVVKRLSSDSFTQNFNAIMLFIAKSKIDNVKVLSQQICNLVTVYFYAMTQLAFEERSQAIGNIGRAINNEKILAIGSVNRAAYAGITLSEKMLDLVSEAYKSSRESTLKSNQSYEQIIANLPSVCQAMGVPYNAAVQRKAYLDQEALLKQEINQIKEKFVSDFQKLHSHHLQALFASDLNYREKDIFFAKSESNFLYANSLFLFLKRAFNVFVFQPVEQIDDKQREGQDILIESIVDLCLANDYNIDSLSVKKVEKRAGGLSYVKEDTLSFSLARLSGVYVDFSYSSKKKKMEQEAYAEAARSTISCFNLFWQKLSNQKRKEVISDPDCVGVDLVTIAIEGGSYNFLENLLAKIAQCQDIDYTKLCQAKRSPLFMVIDNFDFKRLQLVLDSALCLSLDGRLVREDQDKCKAVTLIEYCLQQLDSEIYVKRQAEIDKIVALLKLNESPYDRSYCLEILARKSLSSSNLAEIIRAEIEEVRVLANLKEKKIEQNFEDISRQVFDPREIYAELDLDTKTYVQNHEVESLKDDQSEVELSDQETEDLTDSCPADTEQDKKEIKPIARKKEQQISVPIVGKEEKEVYKKKRQRKQPRARKEEKKAPNIVSKIAEEDKKEANKGTTPGDDERQMVFAILDFALENANIECYNEFTLFISQYKQSLLTQDIEKYLHHISTAKILLDKGRYTSLLTDIFALGDEEYFTDIFEGNNFVFDRIKNEDRIFLDLLAATYPGIFFAHLESKMFYLIKDMSFDMFFFIREKYVEFQGTKETAEKSYNAFDSYKNHLGDDIFTIIKSVRSDQEKILAKYAELVPQNLSDAQEFTEDGKDNLKKSGKKVDLSARDIDLTAHKLSSQLAQNSLLLQEEKKHDAREREVEKEKLPVSDKQNSVLIGDIICEVSSDSVVQKTSADLPVSAPQTRGANLAENIKIVIHEKYQTSRRVENIMQGLSTDKPADLSYCGSNVYCQLLQQVMVEEDFKEVKRRDPKDLNLRVFLSDADFNNLHINDLCNKLSAENLHIGIVGDKRLNYLNLFLTTADENYQITIFNKDQRHYIGSTSNVDAFALNVTENGVFLTNPFVSDLKQVSSRDALVLFEPRATKQIFFGPVRYPEGVLIGKRELIGAKLKEDFQSPYYPVHLGRDILNHQQDLRKYERDFIAHSAELAGFSTPFVDEHAYFR